MSAATKPRVALFTTTYLRRSQPFIYDEMQNHSRYDVDVFCHNRENGDLFPWPRVHSLADRPGVMGTIESLAYEYLTMSPTYYCRLAAGYRLLHAHFGTGSVYALPYASLLALPLIVTFHGFEVPALLSARRLHPRFWRYWAASPWMLRRVDRFLAASEELGQMLVRLGAPEDRVHVWRLGVALPPRPPIQRRKPTGRVLMVGRFVEKKGFEIGVAAFARAAAHRPNARLSIVGDGVGSATLRRLVDDLGLTERVRFPGWLDRAEVMEEMAASDVLLAPSVVARNGDRDSGLIVVKEAAARGVPAVASLHGGIPEIVDHRETGFLAPERDVSALAEHLGRLLDDDDLRKDLGAAARLKMEREYDVRARVAQLEQHYDEICAAS